MPAVWTCDNCGEGRVFQVGGLDPTLRLEVREMGRGSHYLCSGDCLVEWAIMNTGTKKYVLETMTETRLGVQ